MYKFNARDFSRYGFIRNESGDFYDDGTKFKSYIYDGMEVTYARDSNYVYISPSVNSYLKNNKNDFDLTYYDYRTKEWYRNLDMFNGYDGEVNLTELTKAISKFKIEIANLNNELKEYKVDINRLEEHKKIECENLKELIDTFKNIFDCFEFSDDIYSLTTYIQHFNHCKNDLEKMMKCDFSIMSNAKLREYEYRLTEYAYVLNSNKSYHIEKLKEYLNNKLYHNK